MKSNLKNHYLEEYNKNSKLGNMGLSDNLKKYDNLFHYTTIDALENILGTKELWATRWDFLNDKKEIYYTKELVLDILSTIENDIKTETYDYLTGAIEIALEKLQHVFILSFSKNSDSLPIWAYYSKMEGCNIGFDSHVIEGINHVGSFNGTFKVFCGDIIYDRDIQKNEIKNSIDFIDKIIELPDFETIFDFSIFFRDFLYYFVLFKSDIFKSEEEFRIALIYDEKQKIDSIVNTRTLNGLIAKYIKVSIFDRNRSFPVVSIRLGPKYKHNLIKYGVKSYVKSIGYDIDVIPSDLPLR